MSVAAAQQAAGSSHGDPVYIPLSERRSEHTLDVPGRCLKDPHNPSQKSLQRWDNEGGATKRGLDRRENSGKEKGAN